VAIGRRSDKMEKPSGDVLRNLLATNLRRFRRQRGLTQHDVAARGGLDPSYPGDVENARHNVTLQSIEKLAEALGLLECPGILLLSEEDIEWLLARPRGRAATSVSKVAIADGRATKRRRRAVR
jgi:transcriptional regulator with XRE-family HTH domain